MPKTKPVHMFRFLFSLKGNAKACVWTEPLWGIPYNLYTPFATVYMYSLGVTDIQIGILLSIGLFFQVISSLLGGVITDKCGRRWTTFIIDTFSWSIPCLLLAFSQNFFWFLAAAIINSARHMTIVSWECLWIEESHESKIAPIYNWVYIAGLLAVFFVPIAGFFVQRNGVIPVVRVLYIIAFFMMSLKFILTLVYTKETDLGKKRMRETKNLSWFTLLRGYKSVFKYIMASRETLRALALTTLVSIKLMISTTFFSLYATQNLLMPDAFLAYFPILRAAVMLAFLFVLQTRLDRYNPRYMMIAGLLVYGAGHLSLLAAPADVLWFPALYTVADACGAALLLPRMDTLVARTIEPTERARIRSLISVITLGITAPFGYFAGMLSDADRRLPFILNLFLFLMIAFTLLWKRRPFIANYDKPTPSAQKELWDENDFTDSSP